MRLFESGPLAKLIGDPDIECSCEGPLRSNTQSDYYMITEAYICSQVSKIFWNFRFYVNWMSFAIMGATK